MDKVFAKDVLAAAHDIGISHLTCEMGRGVMLRPGGGFRNLFFGKNALLEDPIQIFSFVVASGQARAVIEFFAARLRMDIPGRGTLYAEDIRIPASFLSLPPLPLSLPESAPQLMASDLMAIRCITQQGEGNRVAEIGLRTGTGVPAITFGTGTGLRNRLGLWRVLIPAEKEITTLVVDEAHAETVMDRMIQAGSLDQPGKGFISLSPVSMGILNTRFAAGPASQAASIEQIVAALDEIRGNTEWRRKSLNPSAKPALRRFLTGLVNFSMICNEGLGEAFTRRAMEAGAGGATLSLLKHIDLEKSQSKVSPAREISVMTIGENQVEEVLEALRQAGLFMEEAAGEVQISLVPKACTFLGDAGQ
ncbi:hypothetical protein FIM25_06345 [Desulfobotulus mexicanus]|uniref:Uncharacterized protein n=2 Tax=Desulfobotulus mexicanus TaxID=2586642 RepID=A0A5Q4VF54_9BACT|nr:hypothetical protein FIM25_06345 [Desulfobotulus mexicanus]